MAPFLGNWVKKKNHISAGKCGCTPAKLNLTKIKQSSMVNLTTIIMSDNVLSYSTRQMWVVYLSFSTPIFEWIQCNFDYQKFNYPNTSTIQWVRLNLYINAYINNDLDYLNSWLSECFRPSSASLDNRGCTTWCICINYSESKIFHTVHQTTLSGPLQTALVNVAVFGDL